MEELPTSTSFLPCRNKCCRSSTAESELISGLISGPIPREGPEPLLPTCSRSELIIASEQSVYSIFGALGGLSIMGEVRFIPAEYFSVLTCGASWMVLLLFMGPVCIGAARSGRRCRSTSSSLLFSWAITRARKDAAKPSNGGLPFIRSSIAWEAIGSRRECDCSIAPTVRLRWYMSPMARIPLPVWWCADEEELGGR